MGSCKMKSLRFFFFVWGVFAVSLQSYSDNTFHYYFRTLGVDKENSIRPVNSILQDRQGFIWFGSMMNGLGRYDGVSFKYYNQESGNFQNNYVTTLYEDYKGVIWIGTDAGVYTYSPYTESIRRFETKSDLGTSIKNTVTMITGNEKGEVWISVDGQGLFRYDSNTEALKSYFSKDSKQTIPHNITCFLFAPNAIFWVALYTDNLYYVKDDFKTLIPFVSKEGLQPFKDETISKILPGPNNRLYVGTSKGGLKEINWKDRSVRNLLTVDEEGKSIYVRDIIFYSDNELWVGTESGIFIYDLVAGKVTHLKSRDGDPYALSDNAIYALYKDREGGMWIGSYFGGVDYYPKQYTYFEKVYPGMDVCDIGKRVREFCESNDGTVWIGTEDAGLFNYNPANGAIVPFRHPSIYHNIHGLCRDGNYLWVGTFSKGLNRIDLTTKQVKNYSKGTAPNTLSSNDVFTITRSSEGGLWLGTTYGLLHYNEATDDFTRIPELSGVFVSDAMEDSRGNLWLVTNVNGVYKRDAKTRKWEHFEHREGDPYSLPFNKVLSVFEDSKGQMWFTMQNGGFCRFDGATGHFISYDSRKELPSNTVCQIVEDNKGHFWLTTNRGLVDFDPATGKMEHFTQADGLLSNQFNYQSSYKDHAGKIYLGTIKGFMIFNPATFVKNTFIPQIVITDFRLFGEKVQIGAKGSPLQESITQTKELVLNADQNSFSFRVAALSYRAPQKNKLIYKLEGFDTDWHVLEQSPVITYSNLPYGTYKFLVKGSNSNGVWNKEAKELVIRIRPPFYLSWWAYCLYVLLAGFSVWGTILYFKRRAAEKSRRQMEKFEQEKERELYTAKIDFFTNVTHEIRTPLTLIKAPLENLLYGNKVNPEVEEDLRIMDRNTNRLLDLTNQLLDFRKTEKEGFRLIFVKCDITATLQSIYIRFIPFARQRKVELSLNVPEETITAAIDKEAFTKIISNLLTNAIKHAGSYIRLSLELMEGNSAFRISVTNDGVVIPLEMREEIFKPFVQYKSHSQETVSGTGIGLALSRSLAELHKGLLNMDHSPDCNNFQLTLPLTQDEMVILKSDESEVPSDFPTSELPVQMVSEKDLPVILLVEDNAEMSAYIARQLSSSYRVYTASDGIQALEMLENQFVNLIISDIMMPRMDGIELCCKLKSELNYSHIPLILLTAKTALQSKIEGLNSGADAYIEKPFSIEYLKASISSLLINREKIRAAFLNSPFTTSGSVAMTKADEKFLQSLNEIVTQHMQDPDFCLDDMATFMSMSRSSLNRKIKGILDLTPNDYIRLERLKRAAVLLKEGDCRINEVCYQVGFNTPSYFTKCFQKQFGMLPKDFAAK